MKKIIPLTLITLLLTSFAAEATEALKCYAFYGVTYESVNSDGSILNPTETSKVILERTVPIVKGKASIQISTDQLSYDADYDGKYFRLALTDLTNGQETHFFGPSNSFKDGVDTCIFLKPSSDSKMKLDWTDLNGQLGDVLPNSLKIEYATVQCNKVSLK